MQGFTDFQPFPDGFSDGWPWKMGHKKDLGHGLNSPFHSQDLISNSPPCLTYNSHDASLENLVLDQLVIP